MKKTNTKIDQNFLPIVTDKVVKWEEEASAEYKEYRKMWNEWPLKRHVGRVPIHIDVEATSDCNLKCTMCPRTVMIDNGSFWKVESFDIDKFKDIIDECAPKGLKALKLQYLGEPLLNKNIFMMVKYAKDAGIVDVMFNSNATNLTEARANQILDSGLDKLLFSFDSPDKDEYEEIRVNANYDKTLRNIKRFKEIRDNAGKTKPLTRAQMVKFPGKNDKLKRFEDLFGPLVDFVAHVVWMDHDEEDGQYTAPEDFWINLKDDLDIALTNENGAEELNERQHKHPINESNTGEFCCPQLWQRMFIHPDGIVTPCCLDASRTLQMGNVNESSVEEIWNNEKYTMLREAHETGNMSLVKTCKHCPLAKC